MKNATATKFINDFVMPDENSIQECSFFSDELPAEQNPASPWNIFTDSPDLIASWLERASLKFV